ncbi:conserved hypothetical protein [Candidatus Accumulibacter aalborgensis]|uniref:Inner membrane protein (DUF1819) n=1 Tax=Candidatus Accumulibacter aalborgensis TaxID=1860102 RepID=A0A1A8XM06_9PROT|nr:DUF1819 family protein [Candidatus Accumulibacter aalborgensis]SBT05706.1 conserved hypothetical protein [Candidatus Accumulibacter aalborgensis]
MGVYNAEISAGSLMLPESRRIAALLLTSPSREQWFDALKLDNLLQKKAPATARRQAQLIRKRLETLEEEGLKLIACGSHEVATQLLFAAAIKHSRIFADFLHDVYAGKLRRLEQNLSPAKDWEAFLAECVQRDPDVANLSASTKAKVLQVILRVLAEGRYVDSTKTLRLTPPHLHPDAVCYLKRHGATSVLAIMDMAR